MNPLYRLIKVERCSIFITGKAEAPEGMVWSASGTHELVSSGYAGKGDRKVIEDDLRERIRGGVEPCDDPDCEWCHEP